MLQNLRFKKFYLPIGVLVIFLFVIYFSFNPDIHVKHSKRLNYRKQRNNDSIDDSCFLPNWHNFSTEFEIDCLNYCCLHNETDAKSRFECFISCNPSLNQLFISPTDYFEFIPINIIPKKDKKVISISLYGTKHRYLANSFELIKLDRKLYPDWIPRFYVAADVPLKAINKLIKNEVEVIGVYQKQSENSTKLADNYHGMFWRFFVADDVTVKRFIVRDSDTMPIQREVDAVNEWIKEGTRYHVMRDNIEHSIEILGGMWGGLVDTSYLNVSSLYEDAMLHGYREKDNKGLDQYFLQTYVWPIIKHNMTCHASYQWSGVDNSGCKDFPTPRKNKEFVGAVTD